MIYKGRREVFDDHVHKHLASNSLFKVGLRPRSTWTALYSPMSAVVCCTLGKTARSSVVRYISLGTWISCILQTRRVSNGSRLCPARSDHASHHTLGSVSVKEHLGRLLQQGEWYPIIRRGHSRAQPSPAPSTARSCPGKRTPAVEK
jgi:hypothetical protein